MKKVILLGDSIRLGYEKYVREALSGVCEVYSPEDNCKFAENLLRYASDWKARGNFPTDADLVYWNAGLWDVLHLFGDVALTPFAAYGEFIARIDRRLRFLYPQAKMVFACSTSIVEEKYGENFKRYNYEIEAYNAKAKEMLQGTGTIIHDLYAVSVAASPECRSDATHFNTTAGVAWMGQAVTDVICSTLGITAASVSDTNPDEIDEKKLGF